MIHVRNYKSLLWFIDRIFSLVFMFFVRVFQIVWLKTGIIMKKKEKKIYMPNSKLIYKAFNNETNSFFWLSVPDQPHLCVYVSYLHKKENKKVSLRFSKNISQVSEKKG